MKLFTKIFLCTIAVITAALSIMGYLKYLLIPVWDFYGQRTIEFDHEYIDKQNAEYGQTSDYMLTESFDVQPFVTANALDGTIVDRTLGY